MATMTDLAEWFRAQLDADEHAANEGLAKLHPALRSSTHHARTLRLVQAHRAILDDYDRAMERRRQHPDDVASAADLLSLVRTIKRLTAIYSDRDGYRQEWSA